jgi:hypothetical protein
MVVRRSVKPCDTSFNNSVSLNKPQKASGNKQMQRDGKLQTEFNIEAYTEIG